MFTEENELLYEEWEADQLVTGGITKDWHRIDERSQSLRVYPDVKCPGCNTAITIVETDEKPIFRCDPCGNDATFFLQVFMPEVPLTVYQETHVVCVQVGQKREQIYRIKMNCLSCRKPMAKKELHNRTFSGTPTYEEIYCTSNCGVRTFLQMKTNAGGIYIQPYLEPAAGNLPGSHIETFEIPRSTHLSPVLEGPRLPDNTELSAENFQKPAANQTGKHVDFRGQILRLLKENRRTMARKEILSAITGRDKNIDNAIKALLKDGKIKKVGYGKFVYVRG